MMLYSDTIAEIQRMLDPAAAAARNPTSRQIRRVALLSDGPNEVWCCDGHDKLVKYGFAIWGMRDKFSRKWLGLWVMPNNRIGLVVAYLWLQVVRELGGKIPFFGKSVSNHCYIGLPRQSSTDCGTENTIIHGLAHALR